MKKLLIIITLFASSFFLFCNKEVKAIEFKVTLDDFSFINDDFYTLREKAINYVNSDSTYKYYLIMTYKDSASYTVFLSSSVPSLSCSSSGYCEYEYNPTNLSYTINFSSSQSSSSNRVYYFYQYAYQNSQMFAIDSNFNDYIPDSSSRIFTLNYLDYSFSASAGDKYPSFYDIYLDYNNIEEENPHQEEIDKVTNFYTMVIEKIGYLSEQIASNYILLFVIGIFIITFVFLLIFRRFL